MIKKLIKLFTDFINGPEGNRSHSVLDIDRLILLDAEDLAETGIQSAYEGLKPELTKYIRTPLHVTDIISEEGDSYSVRAGAKQYSIYGPESDNDAGNSWGRATYVFFKIINDQLRDTPVTFYAENGGNDLNGVFLTKEEHKELIESISNKEDWPYLPENKGPWWGQYH